MNNTVLAVQSFGRESEYRRASLTILSYYAFSNRLNDPVLLYTDNPEWFDLIFQGLNVNYVLLHKSKIEAMRGTIDFLHRMKIALIEETFERYPNHKLFYADSDTFFTEDTAAIVSKVNLRTSSMHVLEYPFYEMKDFELPAGQTFQDFFKLITTGTFHGADGHPIAVNQNMVSWNAGVMIFDPLHCKFIPDVYALTDQFYPNTLNHASEQYAFSIILQSETEIIPCNSVNYHYWYRVKKQIADQYLSRELNSEFIKLHIHEKLVLCKSWTLELPNVFENHLLMTTDKAIQAFNSNRFWEGYKWAFKAFVKAPLNSFSLVKDALYHLKRHVKLAKKRN